MSPSCLRRGACRCLALLVLASRLGHLSGLRTRLGNTTEEIAVVASQQGSSPAKPLLDAAPRLLHDAAAASSGNGTGNDMSGENMTFPLEAFFGKGTLADSGIDNLTFPLEALLAPPSNTSAVPKAESLGQLVQSASAGARRNLLRSHHRQIPQQLKKVLLDVGGGTGVLPDEPAELSSHLRSRMEYRSRSQMSAVMLFLFIGYFFALAISLNWLYMQVQNSSPVAFYADPRYHSAAMAGNQLHDFLASFNQPPKHLYLRVSGLVPLQSEEDAFALVGEGREASDVAQWGGMPHRVAFSFALDLASWIARLPAASGMSRSLEEGVCSEDLESLAYFLACDTNDLGFVSIRKETEWPGWEELATNIRQRILRRGFNGIVTTQLEGSEVVSVYKNKTWANFMHNRAMKALAAVSIVGLLPYFIYMRMRCRGTLVRSRFHVDISPSEYWRLIADRLGAEGFSQDSEAQTISIPQEVLPAQNLSDAAERGGPLDRAPVSCDLVL